MLAEVSIVHRGAYQQATVNERAAVTPAEWLEARGREQADLERKHGVRRPIAEGMRRRLEHQGRRWPRGRAK